MISKPKLIMYLTTDVQHSIVLISR